MRLKYISSLLLPISLLFTACGGSEDDDPTVSSSDQSEALINYADNFIIPSYTKFKESTESLKTTLEAYTSDDHDLLKTQVDEAYSSWQSCAFYDFGPALTQLLQNNINIYPVDTTLINTNVENEITDITSSILASQKGLPALDFIVNSRDSLSTKEINYLKLVVVDMNDRIVAVVDTWTGSSDFRGSFVTNLGTDEGASLSIMLNSFIKYFEKDLRDDKLGIPLGIRSFDDQLPEKSEAFYSNISHLLLQESIETMKEVFYGGNGEGFDDLLNEGSNSSLLDEATSLWNTSETSVNQINTPIEDYVQSNQQDGKAVYTDIQELLVLLKIELTSSLGVKINFVDTDGD